MSHKHKAKIFLNNREFVMVLSYRNDLAKDSIVKLCYFLKEVGLTPDKI